MANHRPRRSDFDTEATYRITVKGYLDSSWADRLGGMTIVTEQRSDSESVTTLVGPLIDQAALAGVLGTLYELGLVLVSVELLTEQDNRAEA